MNQTYLETDRSDLVLRDGGVIVNDIRERTTLHKLHHHPQLERLLLQEGVQEVDNVVVPALLHHDDLVHDQLLARL